MSIQRVAVIGTGMIGGSVALGVRAAGIPVVGYDAEPATVARAHARGVIDVAEADPRRAVAGADVVVIATPVDRVGRVVAEIAPALAPRAAVTDVGSVKQGVVRHGVAAVGPRFVGGHPMAGSERAGLDAADPEMFQGAWWILTPTEATDSGAYMLVTSLVELLGATPLALEPGLHDDLVGRLSHVPQIVASALVATAVAAADRGALLPLAGAGFRDVTRIAGSDPDLWLAILEENRGAIAADLDLLQRRLVDIARMLEDGRWPELRAFLADARRARLELFARPDLTGAPVTVSLPVPDRPGVLAEVTTIAGQQAINIEDLEIAHSTEGGRGTLRLVVAGAQRGRALADLLRARGHHAVVVDLGDES